MEAASSDSPQVPRWTSIALATAVWLFGCPLAGIFAAVMAGSAGPPSMFDYLAPFLIIDAAWIGGLGAVLQILLSRNRMFLRRNYFSQVLILAGGAILFAVLLVRVMPLTAFIFAMPGMAVVIVAIVLLAAWIGVKTIHRGSSNSRWGM